MRVTTKKLGQIRSALFVNRQPWSLVRLGQVRFLLLGQLWIALDSSGQFWIVLDSFGQFWIVLDSGWLKKIAVNYLKQLFVWNLRYVQDSTTLAWIVREAQEKPKQKPKKPKWFLLLGQLRIVLDSSGQFWIALDSFGQFLIASQLKRIVSTSFLQVPDSFGQFWIVLDSFGQFLDSFLDSHAQLWTALNSTGQLRVALDSEDPRLLV